MNGSGGGVWDVLWFFATFPFFLSTPGGAFRYHILPSGSGPTGYGGWELSHHNTTQLGLGNGNHPRTYLSICTYLMAGDGCSGENDKKHSLVACARSNKEFKNFTNISVTCTYCMLSLITFYHCHYSAIFKAIRT